jgi:hypothetical protein
VFGIEQTVALALCRRHADALRALFLETREPRTVSTESAPQQLSSALADQQGIGVV